MDAPRRPGRPLLLTPDLVARARELIPRTLYAETVAAHLGVHRETFWLWLRDGSREQRRRDRGVGPDPKLDLHCELFGTVQKALAETEADHLSMVQAAGTQAWQALAWVLERRFPQRWATNRGELRQLAKQIAAIANQGQAHAQPRPNPGPEAPPAGDSVRGVE